MERKELRFHLVGPPFPVQSLGPCRAGGGSRAVPDKVRFRLGLKEAEELPDIEVSSCCTGRWFVLRWRSKGREVTSTTRSSLSTFDFMPQVLFTGRKVILGTLLLSLEKSTWRYTLVLLHACYVRGP